ncbi:MAG: ADP-ribosylglycohydrolase family protein [Alphaproteobacteria bacterium]|uniref:ADP-ribosylglycohydrolase family protein n=1 Tax=Candidatus Nitrobium versatile TaxID=2884831 RepID=A0A953J297_9BACT|nr:ADP-ribosylglycohydrolase family protein [Candidatus Nitrobium versatile]
MIGAIAGDIIGSVYELHPIKSTEFPLFSERSTFTDDTVLTIAVADAILHGTEYAHALKEYGRRYPDAGYGEFFQTWLASGTSAPYNSYGNGSAMRVSPVGFAFDTLGAVLEEAKKSAEGTHNHPEGIKGAQATAAAVFLARRGKSKGEIRKHIEETFLYSLDRSLDEIRPVYTFDASCQGSVPEAIISFLESESYEDAVRKAVSLGGDSDTLACIAGGIAQAYYRVLPTEILSAVRRVLPSDLLSVVEEFERKYL